MKKLSNTIINPINNGGIILGCFMGLFTGVMTAITSGNFYCVITGIVGGLLFARLAQNARRKTDLLIEDNNV